MFIFFTLHSLVNAFISSFCFYLNIGNMHTKTIPLNIRFSIVKKCEKLKLILIMPLSVIKICFNGKGSPDFKQN